MSFTELNGAIQRRLPKKISHLESYCNGSQAVWHVGNWQTSFGKLFHSGKKVLLPTPVLCWSYCLHSNGGMQTFDLAALVQRLKHSPLLKVKAEIFFWQCRWICTKTSKKEKYLIPLLLCRLGRGDRKGGWLSMRCSKEG